MALEDNHPLEFNIAYHPSPYPHAMRDDLTTIGSVCDGIYLPVTESDLLYGPQKVKYCIDIAHEVNLKVVVDLWGYGNLFASGAVPSLLAIQHPELNVVTGNGRSLPKSCPNKPATRRLMKEGITRLMEQFAPDGLFWDEPSWALPSYLGTLAEGEWGCACDDCRAKYRGQFGGDMPSALTDEVRAFRDASLVDLLGDLCTHVKSLGEHLITSTCVMPTDTPSFREAVGRTPNLDIFGIDPYWQPDQDVSQKAFIGEYAAEAVRIARANGKLSEIWVKAYDQGEQHERDAYRAAKYAAAHEVDFLCAWSYRDYQSWVPLDRANPGDPEAVWENLRQAYHEIREGDTELQ